MEDYLRAFVFFAGVVILLVLGASLLVCAGLSDVVHWQACGTLLDFAARTVRAVANSLGL